MGTTAAYTTKKGPRYSNPALSQKVRVGKIAGADCSLSWFLWEFLVCSSSHLEYALLHFYVLSFQNPSPSTLSFMICEEVFFTPQNFTFSLSLHSFPSCKCQVFGRPKSKVGRLGVALVHRDVGAGSPGSPAELSLGWSTEPWCSCLVVVWWLLFLSAISWVLATEGGL